MQKQSLPQLLMVAMGLLSCTQSIHSFETPVEITKPLQIANYTRNFIFAAQVRTKAGSSYSKLYPYEPLEKGLILISAIPSGSMGAVERDDQSGLFTTGNRYDRVLWVSSNLRDLVRSISTNSKSPSVTALYVGRSQTQKYITIAPKNTNASLRKFAFAASPKAALETGDIQAGELLKYGARYEPATWQFSTLQGSLLGEISERYTKRINEVNKLIISK